MPPPIRCPPAAHAKPAQHKNTVKQRDQKDTRRQRSDVQIRAKTPIALHFYAAKAKGSIPGASTADLPCFELDSSFRVFLAAHLLPMPILFGGRCGRIEELNRGRFRLRREVRVSHRLPHIRVTE